MHARTHTCLFNDAIYIYIIKYMCIKMEDIYIYIYIYIQYTRMVEAVV